MDDPDEQLSCHLSPHLNFFRCVSFVPGHEFGVGSLYPKTVLMGELGLDFKRTHPSGLGFFANNV